MRCGSGLQRTTYFCITLSDAPGAGASTKTREAEAADKGGYFASKTSKCCILKINYDHGFIFRRINEDGTFDLTPRKTKEKEPRKRKVPVDQFTLYGEFVERFPSMLHAARAQGLFASGIRTVVAGKGRIYADISGEKQNKI